MCHSRDSSRIISVTRKFVSDFKYNILLGPGLARRAKDTKDERILLPVPPHVSWAKQTTKKDMIVHDADQLAGRAAGSQEPSSGNDRAPPSHACNTRQHARTKPKRPRLTGAPGPMQPNSHTPCGEQNTQLKAAREKHRHHNRGCPASPGAQIPAKSWTAGLCTFLLSELSLFFSFSVVTFKKGS